MGRGIGGGVRENNAYCFLLRMAHLLIFIHNSGIWKGTIQSRLKNSTHFSCYQSLSRGYNVQISKCLTLTWEISNIKCRCYHVANFSTMASALYRENSTCISSQEVKLQVKLPVEKKKNILRLWTGFVPFFEQKLQGLFKDFQGHISHFSRTPFSAKKRFESMSFLVLPQHEQFYPEGLSY